MAIKGLNKVINNLKNVRKALKNEIDKRFISLSLDWISFKANQNLDENTSGIWGSNARSWTKKIDKTRGILENNDMNSASIEFGIGRKGAHIPKSVAQEVGFEYDKPSEYKDDNGRWIFYDEKTEIWVGLKFTIDENGNRKAFRTFNGYIGKSFLYDAFMEYKQNRVWVTLYQQAFDEIMRGVIK